MSQRLRVWRGPVKNRTGHLSHHQGKDAVGGAKEKAEKESQKESPFVRQYVAIKTPVRFPGDPNGFAKRKLFLLGFVLHTADAAGTDSIERIASITAAVEIWFIGLLGSGTWKWRSGSGESPNKIAAGLFLGRQ